MKPKENITFASRQGSGWDFTVFILIKQDVILGAVYKSVNIFTILVITEDYLSLDISTRLKKY